MKTNTVQFEQYLIKSASVDELCLLSKYHYRPFSRQPYVQAWKITDPKYGKGTETIGIITYSMPVLNSAARRSATGNFFAGADKRTQLRRLNEHARRISRVVIDPRYRGLGLAGWLVSRTMPRMNVAMIETTAVMGRLGSFFERAGMHRIDIPVRPEAQALAGALKTAGIEESLWIDAAAAEKRLLRLPEDERKTIQQRISRFMGAYGKRRAAPAGEECMRFALSRLNARPAYYIWLNPDKPVEGLGLTPCPTL
jgi:GNAT superfamily N-acetyltransferase